MPGWSLAATPPNAEFKASRWLRYFDRRHILFTRKSVVVKQGRKAEQLVAAWPRYIFVWALGSFEEIFNICKLRIISHQISEHTFRYIEELLDKYPDHVLPKPERHCRFQAGDKVLIQGSGLLAGKIAVFKEVIDDKFVLLEQEWLGRWVQIPIDERDISKFSDRKQKRNRRSRWKQRHLNLNSSLVLPDSCSGIDRVAA